MLSLKYLTTIHQNVVKSVAIGTSKYTQRWKSTIDSPATNPFREIKNKLAINETITKLNQPIPMPTLQFEQNDQLNYQQDLEIDWEKEMNEIVRDEENASPLDIVENTMSIDTAPSLRPTFNLAAYVNKSQTLQEMLKIGVDLSRIEKRIGISEYVLQLDFERDMKKHITFLIQKIGINPDTLGWFLTKNPQIFTQNLDDLDTRINYLVAKRFPADGITRIVEKNPFWLMFSTQRIDRRLGHFQKEFKLTGHEVRTVAIKKPSVITYSMEHIKETTFLYREECDIGIDDLKKLLLKMPALLMKSRPSVLERYDFAMKKMFLTNDDILEFPEILIARLYRLKERHGFLRSIGRAQYNPKLDLYVSPRDVVVLNNSDFALNAAKSTPRKFDEYLRTL